MATRVKATLDRREFRATIAEVVEITNGTGIVRYRAEDGEEGTIGVIAEGWDYIRPNDWPPQVGDEIKVWVQPGASLYRRRGNRPSA